MPPDLYDTAQVNIRLPRALVQWMDEQPEASSRRRGGQLGHRALIIARELQAAQARQARRQARQAATGKG